MLSFFRYIEKLQHLTASPDKELEDIVSRFESFFRIKLTSNQLIAIKLIVEGNVVELGTGSGKTYVLAVAAIYINKVLKKQVIISTFNEYLVERDYKQLKNCFRSFELHSRAIKQNDTLEDKLSALTFSNVTYATMETLCFLYMETNRQFVPNKSYLLIDEIDNALLDNGLTDFVLSDSASANFKDIFNDFDFVSDVVKSSKIDIENSVDVNFNNHTIHFKSNFLRDFINYAQQHNHKVNESTICLLKIGVYIHYFIHFGIEYDIKNEQVVYVDPNLGRIIEDVRFGNGIHEYLTRSHNLEFRSTTRVIDKVNIRTFIKFFKFVSGVSGSVYVSRLELLTAYNLKTISLKTNFQMKKKYIFCSTLAKKMSIITQLIDSNQPRPILVVTSNINESIYVYNKIDEVECKKYSVSLLNARDTLMEEEMFASAGEPNTVLVTTNLASRGVDIKVGGQKNENDYVASIYQKNIEKALLAMGGLIVINTQPAVNNRVQEQINGRTARQKQPGTVYILTCDQDNIYDFLFKNEKVDDFKSSKKLKELRQRSDLEQIQSRKHIYQLDLWLLLFKKVVHQILILNRKYNMYRFLRLLHLLLNFKLAKRNHHTSKEKLESTISKIFDERTEIFTFYLSNSIYLNANSVQLWIKHFTSMLKIILKAIFD